MNDVVKQVDREIADLAAKLADAKVRRDILISDMAIQRVKECKTGRVVFNADTCTALRRLCGDRIEQTSHAELMRTGVWARCEGVEIELSNKGC